MYLFYSFRVTIVWDFLFYQELALLKRLLESNLLLKLKTLIPIVEGKTLSTEQNCLY